MNVRYSARARAQIEQIHDYIAKRNAAAARVVVTYIRRAVSLLASYPQLGRVTDEKNVRILVVPRFPYVVFFKANKKEILILTVMHAAQER